MSRDPKPPTPVRGLQASMKPAVAQPPRSTPPVTLATSRQEHEISHLDLIDDVDAEPRAAATAMLGPVYATPPRASLPATSASAQQSGVASPARIALPSASSAPLPAAPPSTPSMELVGRTLADRYQLARMLGEGGMGYVYLARDMQRNGIEVAVKVLRADLIQDEEITTRFFNEARAASTIGSPHIVEVSDYGMLPDRTAYFTMEYLAGRSLGDAQREVGVMPLARLIGIARQLASGLAAAHQAGIVHRDLKPENIMLLRRDAPIEFVKILDFGIAKFGSQASRLTRAGSVFGTPQYMSPEQAAGVPVDHRSDIYSLGILMFEMSTGKVPFDDENVMTVLSHHMFHNLPALRAGAAKDLPAEFEAIVKKCLAKKPDTRYSSMEDLIVDLDALQAGLPTNAFEELTRDSERFAAPAPYGGARVGSATITNLTAPTAPQSFLFPLVGVAAAAILALGVGLAIVFKVRSDSFAAQQRAEQSAAEASAARSAASASAAANSASPAATASTAGADDMVDVVVTLEPKTANVRNGDAQIAVVQGGLTLRMKRGDTAKLYVAAPGFVARDVAITGLAHDVAVKLDPARTIAGPIRTPVITAAQAPTAKALPSEANCRAIQLRYDGFGCVKMEPR